MVSLRFHFRLWTEYIMEISNCFQWQLLSFPQYKIGEKNSAYYFSLQNSSVFLKTSISFKLPLQPLASFHIWKSNFKNRNILSANFNTKYLFPYDDRHLESIYEKHRYWGTILYLQRQVLMVTGTYKVSMENTNIGEQYYIFKGRCLWWQALTR